MTGMRAVVLSTALLVAATGCNRDDTSKISEAQAAVLNEREVQLARRVAADDLAPGAPLALWKLPRDLREISGLSLTADGRLLAHQDQRAVIYAVDARRGFITKRFSVGEKHGIRGDFEGITVAGKNIYLIKSNGDLYQFEEGADGKEVRSVLHDTRLGQECEFEGVAFDAVNSWLVMPCKNVGMKDLRDQLVIYRWHLPETKSPRMSMLKIPLERVIGTNEWKQFRPTDVTVDPATGNYVLIAAQEHGLIEITPTGDVVRSLSIPGRHPQAEGVAITADSILIVADEATKGAATITLYRWPIGTASYTPQ